MSAPKPGKRSENSVLEQAVKQLLGATKAEAAKKGRLVGSAQLRREGYSERFIEKAKAA